MSETTMVELEEAISDLVATIGALGTILIDKEICTPGEIHKRINYCISDLDQYSAECRDEAAEESDDN